MSADPTSVAPRPRVAAEYVVPLRDADGLEDELARYLTGLAHDVDVTVVIGTPPLPEAPPGVRVVAARDRPGRNGKVRNVVTGVERSRHERIVLADDDVRYGLPELRRVVGLLDDADVVRPQNHFVPMPWHARWDTARSLVNRAVGADWPGTLAVRRSTLLATDGYDGDVLFENLELVRTVLAAGGRVRTAMDCFVPRRPPTVRHFAGQRVRQAYDSWAQPLRMTAELAVLPVAAAVLVRSRHPLRRAVLLAVAAALLAEVGRRRADGRSVFPASASATAPLWVAERAVCAWIALLARTRGGVRYAGGRLDRAATPMRVLRRTHAQDALRRGTGGP